MKYILSKEYEFEGQKYTEIELNLDVLTGKDVSAVKREWARAGNISPLVAVDTDFLPCTLLRRPRSFRLSSWKTFPPRTTARSGRRSAIFC